MIDVGCGDGHLVKWAGEQGIFSVGYDITLPADVVTRRYQLWRMDLTKVPMTLGKADLVLCWEVAEHLSKSAADVLCDSLMKATAPGGILLFTAAIPGQGGSGHINEQPHTYWRDKLVARGFVWDTGESVHLSRVWRDVAPTAWWYGNNCQVLRRMKGNV